MENNNNKLYIRWITLGVFRTPPVGEIKQEPDSERRPGLESMSPTTFYVARF